ncbi:MAG: AmmeMemoRadiSam system protein A [Oscillospiraceae bacterium]|nr:AmmeMemoRadiSam system protein A [Oscillospiraceae bacterium]
MSIELAFFLPHPPLAVPEVGRGEEKKILKTLDAFEAVAKQMAAYAPQTVVFITPHSSMYADYFHISGGEGASGDLGRFAAPMVKMSAAYDGELRDEIIRLAEESGIAAGTLGEKDPSLDHGTLIPLWFLRRYCGDFQAVRVSQSGFGAAEHYRLGMLIAKAAENLGRRTALIASGDLSHKLVADGPYGYSADGPLFDERVTKTLASGDFLTLFEISDSLREGAAECGYNSAMVLAGCFDRKRVSASLLSYEGPFGVGYAVARFAAVGSPEGIDESRAFLNIYEKTLFDSAAEHRKAEDPYCALARASLEHALKCGGVLPLPEGLSTELTGERAGVFVSFHRDSRLRGCIGTIFPTTDCVALEIIQNAVSAGLGDNRFSPVTQAELPFLSCKVDVLTKPQPVEDEGELDVKRYGVIVSHGLQRGLLLPDLDGVRSVEQQIAIARQKAGIPAGAPVTLERFEVVRHE